MKAAAAQRLIAPVATIVLPLVIVFWALPEPLPMWRSAAIITAWAGTSLLSVSLIFMIREPHFAALLGGLETTYRWHHRSGIAAYLLLLCHPLALALDGWKETPRLAWQTLAPWEQSWPVWLGWASLLLLMFGLATTFAVHLSYRRWRAFHFALGLGVVMGLIHVDAVLADSGPLLALLAIVVLALGWRFVVSDFGTLSYPYRVTHVRPLATAMIEATLAPCAASLNASPGQFVLAAFSDGPHYQGCNEYHPFTISGIHADGKLQVSIKALGSCSRRIQQIEPGVLLRLQGPFGTFLNESRPARQLWIAGGIGITPFIAVLRNRRRAHPITLIYLYKSPADAAFLDELTALTKDDTRFELIPNACGNGVPDFSALLEKVDHINEREIQMCGPAAMVDALIPCLLQLGVQKTSIHHESFDFR